VTESASKRVSAGYLVRIKNLEGPRIAVSSWQHVYI